MTALESFLSATIVERTAWVLLHSTWQIAVIAAVLAGCLRLMRRRSANARYVTACIAMLVMVLLPVASLWFPLTDPGTRPTARDNAMLSASHAPARVTVNRLTTGEPSMPRGSREKEITTGSSSAAANAEGAATVAPYPLFRWLVSAWFLGVLALSLRHLLDWVAVHRLKHRGTRPIGGRWQKELAGLAERLAIHRSLQLLESALVEVPTVLGSLRPVILMPASALMGLTPLQIEALLVHELAHIRRHDYLMNLIQTFVETLVFYHPAAWWVSRRVREERENCCDDSVMEVCTDRETYARALVTMEELRFPRAAVAASGGSLVSRIGRILGRDIKASKGRNTWCAGALLFLTLTVGVFAIYATSDAGSEDPRPAGDPPPTETVDPKAADSPKADRPTEGNAAGDRGDRRPVPGSSGLRGVQPAASPGTRPRGPAGLQLPPDLSGRIVTSVPIDKDCMVLAYMPEWAHGNVDNIAVANNDGGVRLYLDWPPVEPRLTDHSDRRFVLALHSRRTTYFDPVGPIEAYAVTSSWHELTSWNTQPETAATPLARYPFARGEGWKYFDVTPYVRERSRSEEPRHGILLRFAQEDRKASPPQWSGYQFVSREGDDTLRPLLVVVDKKGGKGKGFGRRGRRKGPAKADVPGAIAVIDPLKANFSMAYTALMNDDAETALPLLENLMLQVTEWRRKIRGTPIEERANEGIQRLQEVLQVLKKGDVKKAKLLMKRLEKVGPLIEKQLGKIGSTPKETGGEQQLRFVQVVVSRDALTFEGRKTTLAELPELLRGVADRSQTVLALGVVADDLSFRRFQSVRSQLFRLTEQLGFKYVSEVGEQPLDSKGTKPR